MSTAHVVGQLQRLDQLVPAVGRPAELVGPDLVAGEAAGAQVAAGLAASGADSSRSWYQSTAAAHGVDQAGALLAALALVLVGVAQDDAGLAGQELDGADEVEVLDLAHERDDVALGPAAEAVVDVLLGVDRERAGLLAVERAQPAEAAPDPLELHVLADDGDDVGRFAHPHDVVVDDAHGAEPTSGV